MLPRVKRDAMSALYAFCREVDDVADEESVPVEKRRGQLAAWRADIRRACAMKLPNFPSTANSSPSSGNSSYLSRSTMNCIKGCEMDLDIQRYENFEVA